MLHYCKKKKPILNLTKFKNVIGTSQPLFLCGIINISKR